MGPDEEQNGFVGPKWTSTHQAHHPLDDAPCDSDVDEPLKSLNTWFQGW